MSEPPNMDIDEYGNQRGPPGVEPVETPTVTHEGDVETLVDGLCDDQDEEVPASDDVAGAQDNVQEAAQEGEEDTILLDGEDEIIGQIQDGTQEDIQGDDRQGTQEDISTETQEALQEGIDDTQEHNTGHQSRGASEESNQHIDEDIDEDIDENLNEAINEAIDEGDGDDQDVPHDTVEEMHELVGGRLDPPAQDTSMEDEEPGKYGGVHLEAEERSIAHPQAISESQDEAEPMNGVENELGMDQQQNIVGEQLQEGFNLQSTHVEDEQLGIDSSTLFVSERATPALQPFGRQGTTPTMGPPPRSATPMVLGVSTFAKIRNMQKLLADKKNAATKRVATYQLGAGLDNEAYLESILSTIKPAASTHGPAIDEDTMAARQALAEFQRKKRHYEKLRSENNGHLSFRHDVEWMKVQGAEQARLRKLRRDRALGQEEGHDVQELFPPARPELDTESGVESDHPIDLNAPATRKRRRLAMPRKEPKQISMQDAELQSMRVALDADQDLPKKKRKSQAASDQAEDGPSGKGKNPEFKAIKGTKGKAPAKKASKGSRSTAKSKRENDAAMKQASSLFNSNVFEQQAGSGAADQPTFRARVKADALKELIASVPIEDNKKTRQDINILLAATKEFNGKGAVKADGGFWRVKGMKTSLKPYQVLGTAFMRKRENGLDQPRGGLMADQMGLGKTLMMLANIVNGRPPKNETGPRTTLLVASPALLMQWGKEIEQHTDCNLTMMRYGSGSRIDSNRAESIMKSHDIILTTYSEIMKSYPKNEPPIECQTAEQKIAWWKEEYENQRGPLHRMLFLRVVLDEAQMIKNHTGRTSIACRALMADHKWALSGTPILNSLTELYPYFKFLSVPHTGSFKIFKHNYCDIKDTENTERLLVRLSQFMIRRTHADTMFGAPILKLPQADQSTYWCEFNSVERRIYNIVQERFAKRINMWQKSGDLEKSYSNALVMLLRLRQLTAHVLMLEFVMQELLEREDIEGIKDIVNDQAAVSNARQGQTILAIRKQLDGLTQKQKKATAKAAAAGKNKGHNLDGDDDEDQGGDEEAPEDPAEEDTMDENEAESSSQWARERNASGGGFGKEYNFKPFLASLSTGESWEKAKKKAKCSYCGKQPREPYITSCGHLICKEPCLEESDLIAAEQAEMHSACKACGKTPTFLHPCDAEEEGTPDVVSKGTRANAKKKKKKASSERKRHDREDISEDWLNTLGEEVLPSAKTIAIKAQIMNWRREDPEVKVIIYTQFLAMIRVVAKICRNEGWSAEQYHGKLSFAARDKALNNFAENPNVTILLASLRCGGLGLNLTMASKVIMIDPWWNSASEQQAFCRVFRIGQKEETYMSRLCVRNTVDERLIEMQDKKQDEIDEVMEDKGKRTKKMTLRELMRLFGNLEEDADGKPFILVDNPDPMGGFRADRDDEGYADDF